MLFWRLMVDALGHRRAKVAYHLAAKVRRSSGAVSDKCPVDAVTVYVMTPVSSRYRARSAAIALVFQAQVAEVLKVERTQ